MFDLSKDHQLASDLHSAYVQIHEDLCQLEDGQADPFKASPSLDEILAFRIQALSKYRAVLSEGLESSDDKKQAQSLVFLLQASLSENSLSDEQVLTSWIEACFPIRGDDRNLWPSIYRYAMRRRFDQVCLSLQRLLDDPLTRSRFLDPVQLLTDVMLAYPNARERLDNPYALSQWRLDLQARRRVEDVARWEQHLVNLLDLLEGEAIPPTVRASLDSWQELYVGRLLLNSGASKDAGRLLEDCISQKPSSYALLDDLSFQLLQGSLNLERLSEIPLLGPHLLDSIAPMRPSLGSLSSSSLLAYGQELFATSMWNLGADYLWTASAEGRELLERALFSLACTSDESRQQSIIDLCCGFEMFVLADAIHVMIAQRALEGKEYARALRHALQAALPSLVNTICDAVLEEFYATGLMESLDVADEDSLDVSTYPRLSLLLSIRRVEHSLEISDFSSAAHIFSEAVIPFSEAIPEYLRPKLLQTYLRFAPSSKPSDVSMKTLLEFLNDSGHLISSEQATQLRLHLVRQAAASFLSQ